jgi:predicted RNA polymerase sigma factor
MHLFPNDQGVKLTRAVLLGRASLRRSVAMIDGATDNNGQLGPNELLEKGRLLDHLGRYDDAWAAFAEGKQLARKLSGQEYLDNEAQQQIERLRGFFIAGRLRLLPRARAHGPLYRSRSSF